VQPQILEAEKDPPLMILDQHEFCGLVQDVGKRVWRLASRSLYHVQCPEGVG
jgi:hypothetical protein